MSLDVAPAPQLVGQSLGRSASAGTLSTLSTLNRLQRLAIKDAPGMLPMLTAQALELSQSQQMQMQPWQAQTLQPYPGQLHQTKARGATARVALKPMSPLSGSALSIGSPTSAASRTDSPTRRRRGSEGGLPRRLEKALLQTTAWPDAEKLEEMRTLSLKEARLGERETSALHMVLERMPYLQELDLQGNALGRSWTAALHAAVKHTQDMRTLTLYDCGLESMQGLGRVAESVYIINSSGVPVTSGLKHLILSRNKLSAQGIKGALGEVLKHAPNLETLDLDRNPLGESGMFELATSLRQSRKLSKLGLGECRLGDRGAILLGRGLVSTQDLTELRLECNEIGPEGMASLGRGLRYTAEMSALDLSWNRLGYEGISLLAEGVARCRKLSRLSLNGNLLDPAADRELSRGLLQIASGGLQPAMGRA